MSNPAVVVVMRQADMPSPPLPSKEVECSNCEEPCWLSPGTQQGIEQQRYDAIYVCPSCLDRRLQEGLS